VQLRLTTRHALVVVAAVAGCIVPDREIRIDPGFDNEGAVRIVQRPPRTPEMDEVCNLEKDYDLAYCPEVRATTRSGLLRASDGGDFCVCPVGSTDKRALNSFEIYAEDGDVQGDRAQDTIYGVAFLDLERATTKPQDFVAYRNYWEAGAAGERLDVGEEGKTRTAPPVGRESTQVWVFQLNDGTRLLDLCNDDSGAKLPAGLHNLRFMVTDRPFFKPEQPVDDGGTMLFPRQFGVPDLAAGATYATIDYVFECKDAALDPPGCEPIPDPEDEDTPLCTCDCSSTEEP
jgi:hypothetical protein